MVSALRFFSPARALLLSLAAMIVAVVPIAAGSQAASVGSAPEAGGSAIVVRAAGQGGLELLELQVEGETVVTFQLGSSPSVWGDPRYDDYHYTHSSAVAPEQVRVEFVNNQYVDGVDLNVRVDWIEIDGVRHEIESSTAASTGTWGNGSRCSAGVFGNEVLACNGYIQLAALPAGGGGTTTTAAPTTTAPATTAAPTTTVAPTTTSTPGTVAPTTSSTVAPTTSTTAPPPPVQPTGRFYVVGTDIVDPDGRVFYPIGANVAIEFTPYGYVFEGGNGGVNQHVDDVEAWNWNTIRATLVCDNESGVPSFDELVEGIAPTIERFTDAGVVVILECHDSTGADVQLGSAKDLRIRRFWDTMTERYAGNPYVWFNIYNEPYASADGESWAELHRFYVDRIRATGAENIVVADLPLWGQGIDLLGSQSFADELSRRCNTVFGWHAYGAVTGRQGTAGDHEQAILQAQAKDMALIVGELGVAYPAEHGNAGPWQWNVSGFEAATDLGPTHGIGLLWWHATGDDAYYSRYALKRDRSGFWIAGNGGNLTPYGQRFWDVSHQVAGDREPFTGDLAASGCASAA
jgi:mannan endo-1,4-beta-mannosidase